MLFFAPETEDTPQRGKLLVISGPSGVGKGTLIGEVLPRLEDTVLARSATTRIKRPGEEHGREYYFLSDGEFDEQVLQDGFIEHVEYGSNRYGTLRSEVEENLAAGRNVILEIELEGARAVKKKIPEAVLFFIAPPAPDELRIRLEGRDTDASADIEKRLARAEEELASQDEFDYIVVNDSIDEASGELEQAIRKSFEGGTT